MDRKSLSNDLKDKIAELNKAIFTKDADAAAQLYQQVLRQEPQFLLREPAQYDLARLLENSRQEELAFEAYRLLITLQKHHKALLPALKSAGILAFNLKRYEDCVDCLHTYLESNPTRAECVEVEDLLSRLPPREASRLARMSDSSEIKIDDVRLKSNTPPPESKEPASGISSSVKVEWKVARTPTPPSRDPIGLEAAPPARTPPPESWPEPAVQIGFESNPPTLDQPTPPSRRGVVDFPGLPNYTPTGGQARPQQPPPQPQPPAYQPPPGYPPVQPGFALPPQFAPAGYPQQFPPGYCPPGYMLAPVPYPQMYPGMAYQPPYQMQPTPQTAPQQPPAPAPTALPERTPRAVAPNSETPEARYARLRESQFALILPIGKRIHLDSVAEFVAAKEGISPDTAKKKVLRRKGLLYDNLPLGEVLEMHGLIASCRQSLVFVSVPRELRPYERYEVLSAESRDQGLKLNTGNVTNRVRWEDMQLLNCGRIDSDVFVTIVTAQPAKEFRFSRRNFDFAAFSPTQSDAASQYDIPDFLSVLATHAKNAVLSHTAQPLVRGVEKQPQPFANEEEFRSYTLWMLFSHFAEKVDSRELVELSQVTSKW